MPWVTTAARKGFQGSRLPLGAYRHKTVPTADVVKVAEPLTTSKVIVSAVWEDVSSWEESQQTCSESSTSANNNAVVVMSSEENISCSDDLHIRMERLRRLNPFHHVFSKPQKVNGGVVSMRENNITSTTTTTTTTTTTINTTENSIRNEGIGTVMPVECTFTDLNKWTRTVENDGEDVLCVDTVADTTEVNLEPAAIHVREHTPTGERSLCCLHSWRVQHLAPAEWSQLMELVDEEAIEL
ncbi:uncharacterized protein TM35_000142540 [Trypanosoma theileri]|uniref:Uncharacterized protein n=1 Tax=Trypanosoma theileri TaxID=67003 RepID=A0A1X0NX53_9TRYP|nr:uncharacterized protein TM35_000142540 [Trypanosoma theileri]ORC89043.1 hypothetical protein TM35_000142540 [Trypanosoma theileri]